MDSLQYLVQSNYEKKFDKEKLKKYVAMAEVIDEVGLESYSWDQYQFDSYYSRNKIDFDKMSVADLANVIRQDDWLEFLNDDFVSNLLAIWLVKAQRLIFRKFLASMKDKESLSPGDIKALDAFKSLIEKTEEMENNVIHVQYTSEIPFEESNQVTIQSLVKEYNG